MCDYIVYISLHIFVLAKTYSLIHKTIPLEPLSVSIDFAQQRAVHGASSLLGVPVCVDECGVKDHHLVKAGTSQQPYPPVMTNIAMDNGPLIGDFHMQNGDFL